MLSPKIVSGPLMNTENVVIKVENADRRVTSYVLPYLLLDSRKSLTTQVIAWSSLPRTDVHLQPGTYQPKQRFGFYGPIFGTAQSVDLIQRHLHFVLNTCKLFVVCAIAHRKSTCLWGITIAYSVPGEKS